jgi:hypothetical protein
MNKSIFDFFSGSRLVLVQYNSWKPTASPGCHRSRPRPAHHPTPLKGTSHAILRLNIYFHYLPFRF